MTIKVNIKQLGKKRNKIAEVPFVLENTPSTVGDLIKEAVHNCVFEYNERVKKGEDAAPLSSDEISKMNEIHKMILAENCNEFSEVALDMDTDNCSNKNHKYYIGFCLQKTVHSKS